MLCEDAILHCHDCESVNQCKVCDDGYYLAEDHAHCLACGESLQHCKSCDSPDVCIKCEDHAGFNEDNKTC